MERISEDQIGRLVGFVEARVSDVDLFQEDGVRRAGTALRVIVHKQVGVIRYFRDVLPKASESESLATAAWNLLVDIAQVWQDRPGFPTDAAVQTFDFDAEHPLIPANGHEVDQ